MCNLLWFRSRSSTTSCISQNWKSNDVVRFGVTEIKKKHIQLEVTYAAYPVFKHKMLLSLCSNDVN